MAFHANCQLVTTIKQPDDYLGYLSVKSLPLRICNTHAQADVKQIQLKQRIIEI